jgi:hypothetical protein
MAGAKRGAGPNDGAKKPAEVVAKNPTATKPAKKPPAAKKPAAAAAKPAKKPAAAADACKKPAAATAALRLEPRRYSRNAPSSEVHLGWGQDTGIRCAACFIVLGPATGFRYLVDGRVVCHNQRLRRGIEGCRGALWRSDNPYAVWNDWRYSANMAAQWQCTPTWQPAASERPPQ